MIKEIKDEYLAYPPDYVYSYSNLGVTLLGGVIERVSGKDYASYMDESHIGSNRHGQFVLLCESRHGIS